MQFTDLVEMVCLVPDAACRPGAATLSSGILKTTNRPIKTTRHRHEGEGRNVIARAEILIS